LSVLPGDVAPKRHTDRPASTNDNADSFWGSLQVHRYSVLGEGGCRQERGGFSVLVAVESAPTVVILIQSEYTLFPATGARGRYICGWVRTFSAGDLAGLFSMRSE
jgi:hypothetical protein